MGITNAPEKLRISPLKIISTETLDLSFSKKDGRTKNNASAETISIEERYSDPYSKNKRRDDLQKSSNFLQDIELSKDRLQN